MASGIDFKTLLLYNFTKLQRYNVTMLQYENVTNLQCVINAFGRTIWKKHLGAVHIAKMIV